MKIRYSILAGGVMLVVLAVAGCSSERGRAGADRPHSGDTSKTSTLPGAGKPLLVIGDKNFTEQFLLGELYAQALRAKGYAVQLNRDIGPTEVTMQAIYSGRLDLYPEYLGTWNSTVARMRRSFRSADGAYRAARRYARTHGLALLEPTPFSDIGGVAVTVRYGAAHHLRAIGDLRSVEQSLTFGASPQLQQSPTGLPTLESVYAFVPLRVETLGIGAQYQALDQGAVQAAEVSATDGQLTSARYRLLRDPERVFGWGQVVPVVPVKVLRVEGPAFASTIERVDRLLTTSAMRKLNAAVDVYQQDPAVVAGRFLRAHGLLPRADS